MGNLCCISSKQPKKYAHKPTQSPTVNLNSSHTSANNNFAKKGNLRSPNTARESKKSHRQSEIDYYYDDYEELGQADSSRNHLNKKKKKSEKQAPRQRKLSNKSALSYYSSDVRIQDGKYSLNATQITLLNTTGLDAQPSQAGSSKIIDDSLQYRDNSKVINHLSHSKKSSPSMHGQGNSTGTYSSKQLNLVNTVNLNNQILNNNLLNNEKKINEADIDEKKLFDEINSLMLQDHKELASLSTSNILMQQNESLQSQQVQSMSNIDPQKTTLPKPIQEKDVFESEPNLLNKKDERSSTRKLSNRPRDSHLNNSLKETNRDLCKSYTEDSYQYNEVEIEVQKNHAATDDEDSTTENNAIRDINLEKYRSLQKTKRSIKTIEATMKSSRSIEQWLNDFEKLEANGDIVDNSGGIKQNEKPSISKRKLVKLDKIKRSRTSLDENDENDFNVENSINAETDKIPIPEEEELLNVAPTSKKHRIDSTSSSIMHLDLTSHDTSIATDTSSTTDSSEFSDDDLNLKNFLAEMSRLFNTSLITNNNFTTHPQTCHKLFDTIEYLMQANRSRVVKKCEKTMNKTLSEFLLPRSNANSDDIDLLRWLLADSSTLSLKLVEPVINETLYTNDHLMYSTQKNLCYLLIANSLRIKLLDSVDCEVINVNEIQTIDNEDLDTEKIASLASCSLNDASNEFLKFQLDPSYSGLGDQLSNPTPTGQLILEKKLIESLVSREKKLAQKLASKIIQTDDQDETNFDLISDQRVLEQLRTIMATSNFKGAQCIFNIKKKQLMNKKNSPINNTSYTFKKDVNTLLSPISINSSCTMPHNSSKHNRSGNSSGTTSPSSSSISPASSNRTSNNINSSTETGGTSPYSTFIQCSVNDSSNSNTNDQFLVQPVAATTADTIQFCELNERLFGCLLSNFSCNLVDSFLKNSGQELTSTGFIRKKKSDKSFQYVSIQKQECLAGESTTPFLNLVVEKSNIKLCLKIDKWPQSYQEGFFNRKRINTRWPTKETLTDINEHQGLITYAEPNDLLDPDFIYDYDHSPDDQALFNERKLNVSNSIYSNSSKWRLNTTLAESTLFRSLSKQSIFQFYFLYLVFMNVNVQLSNETKAQLRKTTNSTSSPKKIVQNLKFYFFNFVNERIFMHHYFRFLEIEESPDTKNQNENTFDILSLVNVLKKFSNYLNFILDKYKSLNQPNYFDMNNTILSVSELKCLFGANFSFEFFTLYDLVNRDICVALKDFDNVLNQNLISKLNINSKGLVKLKEIQNLKQPNQQYPGNMLCLLNNYLDTIQLRLPNKISFENPHVSPLPAHYSANTYLYEYVYEYTSIIFEQFKSKRDQFKISESLLLQLHKKIISEKFKLSSSNQNQFVESIEKIDPDRLFSKFEEYAECVHKYLPQIRHNNQYLLFHYVWTMQVQYMAPFFNYLCDFYPPVE